MGMKAEAAGAKAPAGKASVLLLDEWCTLQTSVWSGANGAWHADCGGPFLLAALKQQGTLGPTA